MKSSAKGLELFFTAESIAVIGASTHKQKVGYQVLHNILHAGENGYGKQLRKVYPIHPTAPSILGLPCSASLSQVTDPVELVVIVTPVGTVLDLVNEIIERNRHLPKTKRVRSVIIISAGFAETDKEGKQLQELISTRLSLANIRMIGPNSLGLIHTGHHLNASFAQQHVPSGSLGIISQSGAMLTSLFNALQSRHAGVSFAVSLGNKADITENDCLAYAIGDHSTSAVIMYIESFEHLPQFFELVSTLRRKKPVIVLKGGASSRGQAASASHTAALATNHVLLQAAAQQFGFTLVENMEELMNVAFFLAHHRQLPGNAMVITNAGGPAVNTVDLLTQAKVPLARWSSQAKEHLLLELPKIKAANPLDLLGDASATAFKSAIQIAQRDPSIDSLIVVITPQAVTDFPAIVNELLAIRGKKPLLVSLMGGDELAPFRRQLQEHNIMCTTYTNDIVDMLSILHRAAESSYLPSLYILSQSHHPTDTAQKIGLSRLHHQLAMQQGMTHSFLAHPSLAEVLSLLQKEGFTVPKYWVINDASIDQLAELPYPLYVKTANLSIIHKKKAGAVYGVAHSFSEAKEAYASMRRHGDDVLFQEVLAIDHELLVGIENDPQFCLYMSVGLGGSYTNIVGDRSYCFLPAPKSILERTWRQTRAAQVTASHPQLDRAVITEIERLQKMIMKYPWIHAIEMNPLAICGEQIYVADIKLHVNSA